MGTLVAASGRSASRVKDGSPKNPPPSSSCLMSHSRAKPSESLPQNTRGACPSPLTSSEGTPNTPLPIASSVFRLSA